MEIRLKELHTILKSFAVISVMQIGSKKFLVHNAIRNSKTDYFGIYVGKKGRGRNEINKIA